MTKVIYFLIYMCVLTMNIVISEELVCIGMVWGSITCIMFRLK